MDERSTFHESWSLAQSPMMLVIVRSDRPDGRFRSGAHHVSDDFPRRRRRRGDSL